MADNGTVAKVATIPMCDVHDKSHPAAFDAAIKHNGRRVWAFVCEEAFEAGEGALGLGRGQRLEVEVSE